MHRRIWFFGLMLMVCVPALGAGAAAAENEWGPVLSYNFNESIKLFGAHALYYVLRGSSPFC